MKKPHMIRKHLVQSQKQISKGSRSFFDTVNRDWEKAWQNKVTPWETNQYTPPLKEFIVKGLQSNNVNRQDIGNMRALVPGCGSGYDCLLLKELGFKEVVGLDLSRTAIAQAQRNLDRKLSEHQQSMSERDQSFDKRSLYSDVDFVCDSFFAFQSKKFDFIFDYLFFAAIDANMRSSWGESMGRLLERKESSMLVTLMFPYVENSNAEGSKSIGPPYPIHDDDYRSVLQPHGLLLTEKYAPLTSIKPRKNREVLAVWRYA